MKCVVTPSRLLYKLKQFVLILFSGCISTHVWPHADHSVVVVSTASHCRICWRESFVVMDKKCIHLHLWRWLTLQEAQLNLVLGISNGKALRLKERIEFSKNDARGNWIKKNIPNSCLDMRVHLNLRILESKCKKNVIHSQKSLHIFPNTLSKKTCHTLRISQILSGSNEQFFVF